MSQNQSDKAVVVFRKLKEHGEWIASGVYPMPSDAVVASFVRDAVIFEQNRLGSKFPEFRSAQWKHEIVDMFVTKGILIPINTSR